MLDLPSSSAQTPWARSMSVEAAALPESPGQATSAINENSARKDFMSGIYLCGDLGSNRLLQLICGHTRTDMVNGL